MLMLRNISPKRLASLVVTVAVGVAAGSGLTYHFVKSDSPKKPQSTVGKRVSPPTSIKPDKSKENTEVPVATVAHNFDKYLGLKVIAVGKIAKTDGNPPYILVADDNKSSLVIDTAALNKKLISYEGHEVKLTGTIKFIDIGNQHFSLGIKASSLATK